MDQFAVLADPLRRQVVELLAAGPATAGELAARFPITRPAVSRHLRVLRESGLVRSEVRGQQRVYTVQRQALAELDRWLDRFRPLTAAAIPPAGPAARLDALDTELRRGRRTRTSEAATDTSTTGAHRGTA